MPDCFDDRDEHAVRSLPLFATYTQRWRSVPKSTQFAINHVCNRKSFRSFKEQLFQNFAGGRFGRAHPHPDLSSSADVLLPYCIPEENQLPSSLHNELDPNHAATNPAIDPAFSTAASTKCLPSPFPCETCTNQPFDRHSLLSSDACRIQVLGTWG